MSVPSSPNDLRYVPNVITRDLSKKALAFLRQPGHDWYGPKGKIRQKTKKTRLTFARHAEDPPIPDVFKEIGKMALANYREQAKKTSTWSEREDALFGDDILETLIINHYDPGDSVGRHRDPTRPNPAVLGVTFCEDVSTSRKMRFRPVGDKKRMHDVATSDGSAYSFWGDAYSDWTHESVGSKRQRGVVASATFRARRIVPES